MARSFSAVLCELRRLRGLSQRAVAAELQISQALLSHYENGAREPGLAFVCRACDFYGVSADYMLGRTGSPLGSAGQLEILRELAQDLHQAAERADATLETLQAQADACLAPETRPAPRRTAAGHSQKE